MSADGDAERRAISEKAKSLVKALEFKREREAIGILRGLKTLGVTADLLKKTRIGIIVNGIRRNEDNGEELRRLARDIVFKWKNEISSSSGLSAPGTESVVTTKSGPIKSSVDDEYDGYTERQQGPNKRFAGARSSESSAVPSVSTGDKFRDKCVGFIYNALCVDSDVDEKHVAKLAEEIERHTAEEYDPSTNVYKSRIQSIRFNLRDRNNPGLRNSLIQGELSCREFSKLSTQQMASAERKLSVEKAKKEAMNDSITATDTQAETDIFQCSNCKKRRCKYFQMQTRSSDEPMTTFVSCLNCGKRWKFC